MDRMMSLREVRNELLSLADESNWPVMTYEEERGYQMAMSQIHELAIWRCSNEQC